MPRLVGQTKRVVEIDGLSVDELIGHVAAITNNNATTTTPPPLSVARVTVASPKAEPWLTIQYDEWYCVIKGKVELQYFEDDSSSFSSSTFKTLTVHAGETALIRKGEHFRPIFLESHMECVAICMPAFTVEACHREEECDDEKDERIKNTLMDQSCKIIYHMCEQKRWNEAVAKKRAYYPPTFEADGGFTHATSDPALMLHTANHFYVDSTDDWICLALNQAALEDIGIVTRTEMAKPVGETNVQESDADRRFPHIYGGIPGHVPGIVTNVYSMRRDDGGKFLSIDGLVE